MKSMQTWLDEYGESHRNPVNKLIHWICVPVILFTLLGLLWSLPSGHLKALMPDSLQAYTNYATLFAMAAGVFYLVLSVPLFLGMVFISAACLYGLHSLESSVDIPLWQICLVVFTIAWIGQFIGHEIEGRKPSFFKDVQFLLIGPAWLLHFIYRKLHLPY